MSYLKRRIAPALALCIALPLVVVAPALADDVAAQVAGIRGSSLPVVAGADQAAAASAAAQAAASDIFHADVSGLLGPCESVGEVVGAGPNVSAVFAAFQQSSSHRSIITHPAWTAMGTGLAYSDAGTTYLSVVFCQQATNVAPPTDPGLPPDSTEDPPAVTPKPASAEATSSPTLAPSSTNQDAEVVPVLDEILPAIGARRAQIREQLDLQARSALPDWYIGVCRTADRDRVLEGGTNDSGTCPKAG